MKVLSKGLCKHNIRNKVDAICVIIKSLGANIRMTLAISARIWPVIIDARVHTEVESLRREKPMIFIYGVSHGMSN